jgi:hypothetical protein
MDLSTTIAREQLGRMRGMTRFYHERFFADVRFSAIAGVLLLVAGWWEIPEAFLLVPVVALLGALMTAFDASYLIFARQFAARLEARINDDLGSTVLVAAELEDAYLFPLDVPKIVTVPWSGGLTWFGFMTLFLTGLGAALFGFGLALGLPVLMDHGPGWTAAYLSILAVSVVASLGVGMRWFAGGAGERRLRDVLDRSYPPASG